MQSPNRKSTAAPKDGARVAELEEEVQELKRKLERADARLVRTTLVPPPVKINRAVS